MPDTLVDRNRSPAGLYVHIPFCRSKCSYCAFVSYPGKEFDTGAYLAALHLEANLWQQKNAFREFGSIFIGGGTPTYLSARELTNMLSRLRADFPVRDDAEITIETNPNTIDQRTLNDLRSGGVNRLSIGIQSLNDQTLRRIDRTHTADDARAAVKMARAAGYNNLNLDLIYGLPGQSVAEWQATLAETMAFEPEHLAVYQLSIDPGSRFSEQFKSGGLLLPDEEEEAEMAEATSEMLADSNLERYEISNYARPGRQCRHNLLYWQNGSYLGLGAGAVSCRDGIRISNTPDPKLYEERLVGGEPAWLNAEALPREASFRETVIMGLRLIEGIELDSLTDRFNLDVREYYGETLEKLLSRKLVKISDNRLKLTASALPIANQVLSELV
jgi:oxygen-independent coproporphyrinogen-3 oxidase